MTKLIVVCGWCGKKLGEKDGQGVEGDSHGICDDCLNRYFPHHADKIKECLEVKTMMISTVKRIIIRLLTIAEIVPLKLCPRFWCWLLHKLGRI